MDGEHRVPVRILVCENDPFMRSALSDLIRSVSGFELSGVAVDAQAAGMEAARCAPDVALLDVRMPGGGGPEAARLIRASCPDTRLIAFSAHADRAVVLEMLRAGVEEYLIKGKNDDDLVDAIRRTGRGHLGLGKAEMEELVFDLIEMLDQAGRRVPVG
jgi:DNA-binding NarL/FixJ family response regulator